MKNSMRNFLFSFLFLPSQTYKNKISSFLTLTLLILNKFFSQMFLFFSLYFYFDNCSLIYYYFIEKITFFLLVHIHCLFSLNFTTRLTINRKFAVFSKFKKTVFSFKFDAGRYKKSAFGCCMKFCFTIFIMKIIFKIF